MSQQIKHNIEPIKIALIAVGGDGGGVLTQWIVQLAAQNGYWAQSTTIAGVAQRTGSTVYYLELFPLEAVPEKEGKRISPVLAQMPAPEDVDIVMATELIEAGRAIQRGFVSKKTTLIFSTHRNLAIQEKEQPGDGILDGSSIFDLAQKYAKSSVYANLKELADKNKSVISATLFGALAASGALPFAVEKFEETIKSGGVAVPTSLAAFQAAFGLVALHMSAKGAPPYQPELHTATYHEMPIHSPSPTVDKLLQEIRTTFPVSTHAVIYAGLKHLLEWGTPLWAAEYIKKLQPVLALDQAQPQTTYNLTLRVAQYLALAMAYDDLVHVADVKTRSERWNTVFQQVGAKKGEIVKTTDYFHPRFEEFVGFLPTRLGRKTEKRKGVERFFRRYFEGDRRMHTHNFFWFWMLYTIGGMKKYRLKTLRHTEEMENINYWLNGILQLAPGNYPLAVQFAKAYRLKKGYGDTYARGDSKFKQVTSFMLRNQHKTAIESHAKAILETALSQHELKVLIQHIADLEESFGVNQAFTKMIEKN